MVEATEAIPSVSSVKFYILVAKAEAHVTHNHIVTFYIYRIVSYADAITWGCLPCYSGILRNRQLRGKVYGA